MSDMGKKIKIIGTFLCVLFAAACVVMAVRSFGQSDVFGGSVWFLFASVAMACIYIVFAVSNMASEYAENHKKLRMVVEKAARLEKKLNSLQSSGVDKYSPVNGTVTVGPEQHSGDTMGVTTAMRKAAGNDYTKRYNSTGTIEVKAQTQQVGSLTGVFPNEATRTNTAINNSARNLIEEAFNTTSTDTYHVNVGTNSATKYFYHKNRTIAAGGLHTLALTNSGGVLAFGFSEYGQIEVSGWRDLVQIVAGAYHTIGLKSNGTVLATGYNGYGQCNVSEWRNICSVAAGSGHTVGLRSDGTCVATGDGTYGQTDVGDWTDIIAISAGNNYTAGLKADGTVVGVGANTDGNWGAAKWGSINAIASGGIHILGLKADGTCVAVGNNSNGQCEVSSWKNVVSIAAGNYHSVGLLANGKVVSAGYNGYKQCEVSQWTDVIAIAAGRNHTIGLTKYGTLISTGDNQYGQCSVASAQNLRISE